MLPNIGDETKRATVLQLIRSAVQWIMGLLLSMAITQTVIAAFNVDPDTITDAVTLALQFGLFATYIVTVRLLELHVHPAFGWLNGWRAELGYGSSES